MGLLVETQLVVYRFIFSELFPNVGNLYLQVEILKLENIKMELTLFGLNLFLGDGLPEEFSRMHELLQEVAS